LEESKVPGVLVVEAARHSAAQLQPVLLELPHACLLLPGRTDLPCPWNRGTVDTVACRKAAKGKRQSQRGRPSWRSTAERLSWGADYTDSGLVITTEDGRPFHPETLSGLFVRQARRAGLPPIRLHDLRHSVASILLARGVHPKVVSEMLGHSTIALTLDTYSHVIPSLQQEAASVVAAAVLDPALIPPQAASKGQVRAITSGS
jgi:hypothetical protein